MKSCNDIAAFQVLSSGHGSVVADSKADGDRFFCARTLLDLVRPQPILKMDGLYMGCGIDNANSTAAIGKASEERRRRGERAGRRGAEPSFAAPPGWAFVLSCQAG